MHLNTHTHTAERQAGAAQASAFIHADITPFFHPILHQLYPSPHTRAIPSSSTPLPSSALLSMHPPSPTPSLPSSALLGSSLSPYNHSRVTDPSPQMGVHADASCETLEGGAGGKGGGGHGDGVRGQEGGEGGYASDGFGRGRMLVCVVNCLMQGLVKALAAEGETCSRREGARERERERERVSETEIEREGVGG